MTETATIPALPAWIGDLAARARRCETRVDGVRLQWHVWGDGPALYLFHGGHGSWRHWVRNIEPLARHYRVMAVDLPGFGESDVMETQDLQQYAGLMARSVAQMAPGEVLRGAGFSFGSVIGMLTQKYLESPSHAWIMVGSPVLGRVHPVTEQLHKWRGRSEAERAAAHRNNVGALMLTGQAAVTDEAAALQMSHAEAQRGLYRGLFRTLDIKAELASVTARYTAIYGENDALTGRHLEERRSLVERVQPEGQFHVIPNAGHWVQYEQADKVNAILVERLA